MMAAILKAISENQPREISHHKTGLSNPPQITTQDSALHRLSDSLLYGWNKILGTFIPVRASQIQTCPRGRAETSK